MMDYINDLYDLCDTISKEISDANRKIKNAGGKMSAGDLETIDKMTHTLKSLKTGIAMAEAEDGRSSNRGYDGNFMHSDGYGYGRGRSARRDSMGRYSSASHGLVDELRGMMDDAPNDQIRGEIQRLVDKLERMA